MTSPLTVGHLRCEYLETPLGLDEPRPRFSWQIRSDRRGTHQSAWQVRVSNRADGLDAPFWDSGHTASDQSLHITYDGPELTTARTRYFWQVRAWDDAGNDSGWSEGWKRGAFTWP